MEPTPRDFQPRGWGRVPLPEPSMEGQEQTFLDELQRWYAQGDRDVSAVGPVDLDRVPRKWTPICLAAMWGWCSAIDWLVKKGADVNKGKPIPMKITPLHGAVAHNRLAAARRGRGRQRSQQIKEDSSQLRR